MEVTIRGLTGGGGQDELLDELEKMRKDMAFLFENLDSINVKRLYTEQTDIRSEAGETVIVGPLVSMYDKQIPPVLRLKMGYDPTSGNFLFNLYNKAGVTTVELDSNGNEMLKGTLYAKDAVIGIGDAGSLNYDIGTGSYITLKGAYTVSGSTLVFCRTTSLGGSLYGLERVDFNAGWTYFYGSVWVQDKLKWQTSSTITATSPAGTTGDVIWGTSTEGTGPHVYKSGGWYALQSVVVP